MANPEHLAILKQGVEVWNKWFEKNRNIQPDLSGIDLRRAQLKEIKLWQANLEDTDFYEANLIGSYLIGANLAYTDFQQAELRRATLSGTDLREAIIRSADLREAQLIGANLSRMNLSNMRFSDANLKSANLDGADLNYAKLQHANLDGATLNDSNLEHASLFRANFLGAKLRNANLAEAELRATDLTAADLTESDLRKSEFIGTTFHSTNLAGANFAEAKLNSAVFANVDLSQAIGLEKVIHEGPSTLGIDTIFRSSGNIPDVFLRGCGVPDIFIEYAHSLVGKPIQFYSCFISHSSKDKRFCERLYADLQAKSVRTWYFPEDAKWGESVWGEIDRSIKIYDKLVVVCSKNSLTSGPVLREIERALNREDREGKNILFPITIDDYIFKEWEHPRKADVLAKVVGDFRGWNRSVTKYDAAFKKLLKALQA